MAMALLCTPMAEHQPLAALRVQAHGNHAPRQLQINPSTSCHDAFLGAGHIGTDQRGNFKTTEIETVFAADRPAARHEMPVPGRSPAHLWLTPCGIQAGARDRSTIADGQSKQCTGQRTGGSRVADAHLTANKQLRCLPLIARSTLSRPACRAFKP
jgi:hypothetical protein